MSDKTHQLKTAPEYFAEVIAGNKAFEIRKNDRDFKVGDALILREYDIKNPNGTRFTGSHCTRFITYVTDYEQKEGYVVLALATQPQAVTQGDKIDWQGMLNENQEGDLLLSGRSHGSTFAQALASRPVDTEPQKSEWIESVISETKRLIKDHGGNPPSDPHTKIGDTIWANAVRHTLASRQGETK